MLGVEIQILINFDLAACAILKINPLGNCIFLSFALLLLLLSYRGFEAFKLHINNDMWEEEATLLAIYLVDNVYKLRLKYILVGLSKESVTSTPLASPEKIFINAFLCFSEALFEMNNCNMPFPSCIALGQEAA